MSSEFQILQVHNMYRPVYIKNWVVGGWEKRKSIHYTLRGRYLQYSAVHTYASAVTITAVHGAGCLGTAIMDSALMPPSLRRNLILPDKTQFFRLSLKKKT